MNVRVIIPIVCALTVLSCARTDQLEPVPAAAKRILTVRSLAPGNAAMLASLEVLAFRTEDPRYVYERARGTGAGVQIALAPGLYRLYALGNMPSFENGSETALLNARAAFVQEGSDIPMTCVASQTVDTQSADEITFEMERLWARIVLEGGVTIEGGTLCSIFVLNIPESTPLFGPPLAGEMINHRGIGLSENGTVLDPDAPQYTYHNGPVTGDLVFYAHPNPAEEASSRQEEDDVTKVVLAVRQGEKIRFFPIGLPHLARNHTYTLSGIHISDRPGSTSPNTYVPEIQTVQFTLSVAPFVNLQKDETI